MVDVGNIRILLSADSSGVVKGILTANTSIAGFVKSAESRLKDLAKAFDGLSVGQQRLVAFGIGATLAATALAATIKPAAQFQSAWTGVLKTVDATPAQFARIREGLIDLSTQIPVTANDLASIAEQAGQLGINQNEILDFTEVIAKLGATTDLVNFDAAAQSLARFQNITNYKGPVVDLANIIVELGNNTATTESQILRFATRAAPGLSAAGVAAPAILALSASFSEFGKRAEEGATAISRVFQVLQDASLDKTSAEMRVLSEVTGLTRDEFSSLFQEHPEQAFLALADGLGRMLDNGESITPVLQQLSLTGIRVSDVLRLAAQNTDDLRANLALAEGQIGLTSGALDTEFNKRLETAAAQLQILKNAFTAVAIGVGTNFLPAITAGLVAFIDVLRNARVVLGPLATELAQLFGILASGSAQLAGLVAQPVLELFAAAVAGAAAALVTLVGGINSLLSIKPALAVLAILAADIAFVGPVSIAAAAALTGLGATALTTGFSMSALGGILQTTAATILGPWGLAVALFATIGKTLIDAGRAASEAGDAFREGFNASIESGNYGDFLSNLTGIQNRMEQLRQIDRVGDFTSFDSWSVAALSLVQTLPGIENGVLNARAELAELEKILAETGMEKLNYNIEIFATRLGIAAPTVFQLATNLGLLDDVAQLTWEDLERLDAALLGAYEQMNSLGTGASDFFARFDLGQATMQEVAQALGLTEETLARFAATMTDVDLNDLFSDDPEERWAALTALIDATEGAFGDLETSLGLTREELALTSLAMETLSGAMSAVEGAIENVVNALSFGDDLAKFVSESKAKIDELIPTIDGSRESFAAVGEEIRRFALGNAALSGDLESTQAILTTYGDQLYELARSYGLTAEEAAKMIAEVLGIPEQVVLEFIADTQPFRDEKEVIDATLYEWVEGEWKASLDLDPFDAESTLERLGSRIRFDWEEPAHEAKLRIDSGEVQAELDSFKAFLEVLELGYTIPLDVYTADAQAELDLINAALDSYDLREPQADALLNTEPFDTNADYIESRAEYIDALEPIPTVDADITSALAQFGKAEDGADAYATGDYTASLDADTTNAEAAQIGAIALLTAYKFADFTATIDADPRPAQAQIRFTTALAHQFAQTYVAVLIALDGATGVINRAVAALAGFRSKTITLTAISKTAGANGMILGARGGVEFADGGMLGGVPTPSGTAQIYSPVYPYRVHSEPETGGEAYIPLATSKRPRSIAIWEETGRRLGVYANGGIASTEPIRTARTTTTINRFEVNMDLAVHGGPGVDARELASEVRREVSAAIRDVTRNLDNSEVFAS